ncbi:MAG TPA: hypothetical protein VHO06_24960 [Polyangia bacterium]|nr:hypothetical protein [Polyangia bacterium]
MTSSRSLLVAAAACALAACGNYSNEDLLFMSAVPSSQQLALVLPASTNPNQAELAADTHNGIATVNGLLDDVLGLVDAVRSYEPTSRTPDSRTWGPFADSHNAGWQWRLVVTLEADGTTFDYHLDTEDTAAAAPAWIAFFTGTFDAAGGVKQGSGSVTVDFASLGDAGFPLDANTDELQTLTITYQNYQTPGSPVSVTLMIQRKTPDPTTGLTAVTFSYQILSDGSGQIAYTLVGDFVPGPAGAETVTIDAAWIPSGAGKATEAIVSGDGMGLTRTQCWDASFEQTYNNVPWMAASDMGDPASCPTLPTF